MTDWENYTRLCSLRDSVSSVCRSVQTNAYSNFHHFLFHYPLNYCGDPFVRDLYQTYNKIHFNFRLNDNDMLTDLQDTPPPQRIQTSGSWNIDWNIDNRNIINVSGQVMNVGFPHGVIQESLGRTIDVRAQFQRRDDFDNSSSLWRKFIRKITFSKSSDDI